MTAGGAIDRQLYSSRLLLLLLLSKVGGCLLGSFAHCSMASGWLALAVLVLVLVLVSTGLSDPATATRTITMMMADRHPVISQNVTVRVECLLLDSKQCQLSSHRKKAPLSQDWASDSSHAAL